MNKSSFIKGKKLTIFLFAVMIGALSFLFLVLNEKKTKVSSEYLIVQNVNANQDSYTLAKSAEYVGKVINEVVYSELFIDETVKTGKINAEFLPSNKKDKLKEWSKKVSVSRNPELGILSIEVFSNDRNEAYAISEGIIEVLVTKNYLFRGNGQDIDIRVLSGPVVEKNPSISQIIMASVGGFVFGLLISIAWLYYKHCTKRKDILGMGGSAIITSALYPFANFTKERMQSAGIFHSGDTAPTEEEYRDSLNYLDK